MYIYIYIYVFTINKFRSISDNKKQVVNTFRYFTNVLELNNSYSKNSIISSYYVDIII